MPVNKVRRRGSYAPLSAHYYKDDAIAEAGEAAELLYVRGLAFCADVLSDGFISELQLTRFVGVGMRDATKRAQRLVEVGLWDRVKGGWVVVGWLKWNRSRDDIAGLLKADNDRKGSRPAGPHDEVPPPSDEDAPPDPPTPPRGFRTESDPGGAPTPTGIQPRAHGRAHGRARPPLNSTPSNSRGADADAPAAVTAGTVVAAWVEEFERTGTAKPQGSMTSQVGREARQMLGEGVDPELVLTAARSVGARGYATLHREVVALQRRNVHPLRRPLPPGYDDDGVMRDPKTGVAIER